MIQIKAILFNKAPKNQNKILISMKKLNNHYFPKISK